MSDQNDGISALTALFSSIDDPSPVVLLGAGASFRSGVPTASDAVKEIARTAYSAKKLAGERPPNRIKPTEWEPWLKSFSWFINGDDRFAENFPLAVEHLLVPAEFRKAVLTELMRPRNGLSEGYRHLADLVMRGLIRTILTTNFDLCIVDALKERQPHIRNIAEVNRTRGDYAQFNVFSKCQIVWLHGRAENYSDRNTNGEVHKLDPGLLERIRPLVDDSPVVVVGYRGAEPSIMEGLFGPSRGGRQDFASGIYWCSRKGDVLHPNVEALARRVGSNFRLITIDGFDELFATLNRELMGHDRLQRTASSNIDRARAFDESVVATASLQDLDLDLALSTLRRYCEKLRRAPLTRDSLLDLLREQELLVNENGRDKVTVGALLLFGHNPQRFYPHAVVSLTESGRKREIYDGNLLLQHSRLLERLDEADINPTLKIKRRRVHNDETAYPPRVLTELLVNMLVHRDYAVEVPSSIEVSPGASVTFRNPGGLTPKVARSLTVANDGKITLVDRVSDQRNPAICDLFFGISAMERAGTGLIDVAQLMTGSGGASTFYNRPDDFFEATVSQASASAGSRSIARSDIPTGMYMLNVLPFAVIPDQVTVLSLTVPLRQRPTTLSLAECGTFVDRGSELWSFVPLDVLSNKLRAIINPDTSRAIQRRELENNNENRRVLSWLLRKHFEYHLERFEEKGLILEYGHSRRAYFIAKNRCDREVVWDSAQKRGNRRVVVKRRADGPKAWFENEGIGYDIVNLSGLWGIRIKPFYMFTGTDGESPLPSFSRTAKATRRIKFDRNKSVELDLAFWAAFLGQGNQTMNVGDLYVDDLLIDLSYLTVEVPESEFGLDASEHKDRMSAGA